MISDLLVRRHLRSRHLRSLHHHGLEDHRAWWRNQLEQCARPVPTHSCGHLTETAKKKGGVVYGSDPGNCPDFREKVVQMTV